jgi:Na+/proline symporter
METTDILVGLFSTAFFIFIIMPCAIGNIFSHASYRDALVIGCWLVVVVLIALAVVFGVIFSVYYTTGWYVDNPKLVSMVEWLNSLSSSPPPSAL